MNATIVCIGIRCVEELYVCEHVLNAIEIIIHVRYILSIVLANGGGKQKQHLLLMSFYFSPALYVCSTDYDVCTEHKMRADANRYFSTGCIAIGICSRPF